MDERLERMRAIEARMAEINAEVEREGADLDALSEETRNLSEEYKGLQDYVNAAEERSRILDGVMSNGREARTFNTPVEVKDFGPDSAEYRAAFLKRLKGSQLTEIEERALTSASGSAGAVVPTQTVNMIIDKVKQYAPLLERIELLSVPARVKIPAEGTTTEAKLHAEGGQITADGDTLNFVELGMYEITKLVTISKTVEVMSIDVFEAWLSDKIATKVAEKITRYILNGTGSSEPQGINAITWNGENSVEIGASNNLTEADVMNVIGLLNGGYDVGSTWLISKKTFYSDFVPLQDKSKNNLIVQDGSTWYVGGYPVDFDDDVKLHEAILGNLKKGYVGNLPETANVVSQFVARENAYDYLGTAMFDGKVQAIEAFVKIKKADA